MDKKYVIYNFINEYFEGTYDNGYAFANITS